MIDGSTSGEPAAPGSAFATLCSNMSQGLHAAAQPLSILRASLGGGLADRLNIEELRELTASSAVEVERVCRIFSLLQHLLSAESTKPLLTATPILPLLADATEGVIRMFEEGGMSIGTEVAEACPLALINGTKTLQALSCILLAAYAVSRAGDTIELISSSSPDTVQVIVRNLDSEVDAVAAEVRLSMALAEANIRCQRGILTWIPRPFSAQIEFQTAPSAR